MKYAFLLLYIPAIFLADRSFGKTPAAAPADTIRIQSGLISGVKLSSGVISYKGIPFAKAPVGELRWKAPQPVSKWEGVKECAHFGSSPFQASPAPFSMWSEEFLIPKEPINEDCLNLNVWTRKTGKKLPVLVWIYGGGFSSGGSACPIYDGEAMASKGIVFVSINYRVGIFGFFAHPDLTKTSGNNASGNYGLMDQIAALQWVRENIAAFGGDPDNVTIAGQSAGSMSVNCLVASPLAKGLFHKAIAESGAMFTRPMPALSQAEQEGVRVANELGAASVEELRKVPAAELLKKSQNLRGPIIDGYVLPASVASIFKEDHQNPVTLLTGWNEDEGLVFGPPLTASQFKEKAQKDFGADAEKFLLYYPALSDSEAIRSQNYLSRDQIFGVQNYAWAKIESDRGKKVYVYRFTRKVPGTGQYAKYGAFHTGEVPYAYNNLRFVRRPWQQDDHKLAAKMSAYWINFIKSGDPNGPGLSEWPAFAGDRKIIFFDRKIKSGPLRDSAQLDFLMTH